MDMPLCNHRVTEQLLMLVMEMLEASFLGQYEKAEDFTAIVSVKDMKTR